MDLKVLCDFLRPGRFVWVFRHVSWGGVLNAGDSSLFFALYMVVSSVFLFCCPRFPFSLFCFPGVLDGFFSFWLLPRVDVCSLQKSKKNKQ